MDIYEELVRLRKLGQKCALATIVEVNGSIPSFESAKMLIREDGSIVGTVGGGCVEAEVWNAAREVMETEKARNLRFNLGQSAAYDNGLICGGQLSVFVEPVIPQPQVLIFGGGHVSRAISQIATTAGFSTVIIDDRESFANHERFPEAAAVHAGEYEQLFPTLTVNSATYIIIVTRGHRDDMRVLRWAATTQPRYLAMIGSRRKTLSVIRELEKEGMRAHRVRAIARSHGPRYRRDHAGGNRRVGCRGNDRYPASPRFGLARHLEIDLRDGAEPDLLK